MPQPPGGPDVSRVRHARRAATLYDALEALTHQLVWAADCAEFTDATGNARQFLHAAGHVDLAARAALALAGPGSGWCSTRAWYVPRLGIARALDDPLRRRPYQFRWDIHHEEPVTDPALGRAS